MRRPRRKDRRGGGSRTAIPLTAIPKTAKRCKDHSHLFELVNEIRQDLAPARGRTLEATGVPATPWHANGAIKKSSPRSGGRWRAQRAGGGNPPPLRARASTHL